MRSNCYFSDNHTPNWAGVASARLPQGRYSRGTVKNSGVGLAQDTHWVDWGSAELRRICRQSRASRRCPSSRLRRVIGTASRSRLALSSLPSTRSSASGSSRGNKCDERWPAHIGCSRCEPACSISSYVMTSNAGIRSYEPLPITFAWPRSTQIRPLSNQRRGRTMLSGNRDSSAINTPPIPRYCTAVKPNLTTKSPAK
jgi:hypothetical protein